jgi:ribulose-5-phosphate 4-epimerase/fuculose-1-phosphate aldolase
MQMRNVTGLPALAADMIATCRIIEGKGLLEAYGHVSVRLDDDLMLITPRGAIGRIDARALLVADLRGRLVRGRGTLPLELPMHTSVYRRRPAVRALVRTHSPAALAWGALGRPLRPVHGHGSFLGAEVPVFPKVDLIATEALGEALAETLGQAEAILLRGNGTLVTGAALREACVKAIWLEESARIQCQAAAVGTPMIMTPDEVRERIDVPYDHYGRAWDFYRTRFAGKVVTARPRRRR